jgi:phosphoglycolate phosphatase
MQTIFFDLDGTIVDIQKRYYRVYADSLLFLGGTPLSDNEYWTLKRENTPEIEILKRTGDSDHYETYRLERKPKIEAQDYLLLDTIWEDLYSHIFRLKSTHELILVTIRKNRENLEWQLHNLGLDLIFSKVLSPEDDQILKNGADSKIHLIKSFMGERQFAGWFIGDSEVDIQAGKSLGLRTCAVTLGMRSTEYLAKLGPDVLLENPGSYLEWLDQLHNSKVH